MRILRRIRQRFQQREGNDILMELLEHIAKTHSPRKAITVLEFMMENFPCQKHHLENCPDCSATVMDSWMEIEEYYKQEIDSTVEEFKEFLK